MADRPKTTGRSYAHKPYMSTTGYPESMARPGDKDYDNYTKRPHSDDKKPYMDDEYPEMEHYWTPYYPPKFTPPGIPDDPRIPPMNPNQPPDIEGGPDRPLGDGEFPGCVFGIPVGPTYVHGGETTYRNVGMDNPFKNDGTMDRYLPDPLVRLYVNYGPAILLTGYRTINACMVSMNPTCLVSAKVIAGFDKTKYHQLGEYCPVQVVGVTKSGGKCYWNFYAVPCPPPVELSWDEDSNPETIGPDSGRPIYVSNGQPPYTWTVMDAEFSLAAEETQEPENVLYASADACGTAQITVIDGCDEEVSGDVRCTAGEWLYIDRTCQVGGRHQEEISPSIFQRIEGGKKNTQRYYSPRNCSFDVGGRCSCFQDKAAKSCYNFIPEVIPELCITAECLEIMSDILYANGPWYCCYRSDGKRCFNISVYDPYYYEWSCPEDPES